MEHKNLTVFPYRKNPEGVYFPLIPVRVAAGKQARNTAALIDSGATISIFRTEIASGLGITIESGKEIIMGGVGGRIKGHLHTVTVTAAGKTFSCPMVFSYDYLVSFNLLGRTGFFDQFRISFEEKDHRVELK